jgi:hypothetical protein
MTLIGADGSRRTIWPPIGVVSPESPPGAPFAGRPTRARIYHRVNAFCHASNMETPDGLKMAESLAAGLAAGRPQRLSEFGEWSVLALTPSEDDAAPSC